MSKKKTLEDITTLESGDIITEGGWYREILEVGKQTILTSEWRTNLKEARSCSAGAWYKPSELVNFGYKIYTPEETDDKTEEAMKLLRDKGYKIVKE